MNTLTRQEMQGLAFEPQQPEIEQLDLVRYWRAIARNKWRILALVALVGLIATLYAYSLKPIYRATATVLSKVPARSKGRSEGGPLYRLHRNDARLLPDAVRDHQVARIRRARWCA